MYILETSLDLSAPGSPLFLFARDEVDEFFNSMDRDFDGRLSFEEFMGEESQIGKKWILKNVFYISGRIKYQLQNF